mgnify:CR=1 FL=1
MSHIIDSLNINTDDYDNEDFIMKTKNTKPVTRTEINNQITFDPNNENNSNLNNPSHNEIIFNNQKLYSNNINSFKAYSVNFSIVLLTFITIGLGIISGKSNL